MTSAARVRLEAGLAAGETVFQRAESVMAAEHQEALLQVVQWQAWQQQEQLPQRHGVEARELANKHA